MPYTQTFFCIVPLKHLLAQLTLSHTSIYTLWMFFKLNPSPSMILCFVFFACCKLYVYRSSHSSISCQMRSLRVRPYNVTNSRHAKTWHMSLVHVRVVLFVSPNLSVSPVNWCGHLVGLHSGSNVPRVIESCRHQFQWNVWVFILNIIPH